MLVIEPIGSAESDGILEKDSILIQNARPTGAKLNIFGAQSQQGIGYQ
jgi:hypothetical protein